jgi:hypothetical protein
VVTYAPVEFLLQYCGCGPADIKTSCQFSSNANMRFVLGWNNPLNSTLVDENGKVRYRTQTPFALSNRTTTLSRPNAALDSIDTTGSSSVLPIADGIDMIVVGQIHWRLLNPSTLSYKGFEMPIKEYMKQSSIFSSKYTFTASDGCSYTWVLDIWRRLFVSPAIPPLVQPCSLWHLAPAF